jgi:hypothetical protein
VWGLRFTVLVLVLVRSGWRPTCWIGPPEDGDEDEDEDEDGGRDGAEEWR